ncbi:MAG: Asp-tRNA(Asn)/Glu-tRNA(Gln) amidotransferase subunit GatB [Gemmatimonadales bacterium]
MTRETVIGLEVHVQLNTRSKLFCGCSASFGDPPNTNVCPVCLGLPGALPVTNREAVRYAVRTALALGCAVSQESLFARKHYFYPDLPKGFQISQFDSPLATGGHLDVEIDGVCRAIGITRLHLEEDAGKSLHDRVPNRSAIDFNRCGVPLIEIVSEPDMRSPEEARVYLQALKQILEYLEVSNCNMEDGSLRVDANLSVRAVGDALGTKQEVKNMNSFATTVKALAELRDLQTAALERGETVELTTYSAGTGSLRPLRTKEQSHDYRYFSEPDLPPLSLGHLEVDVEQERESLPELPAVRRVRLQAEYSLARDDATTIAARRDRADYFESVVAACGDAKAAADWVTGPVLADAKANRTTFRVSAERLASLITLVGKGTLSNRAAKQVFSSLALEDAPPLRVAERLNLIQVSDEARVAQWIDEVLRTSRAEVQRYRDGAVKLFGFFMGEVMKRSDGRADPSVVEALLRRRLG